MTKTYCDRCSKQITATTTVHSLAHFTHGGVLDDEWTLCAGCYRAFLNVWLKGFGRNKASTAA